MEDRMSITFQCMTTFNPLSFSLTTKIIKSRNTFPGSNNACQIDLNSNGSVREGNFITKK